MDQKDEVIWKDIRQKDIKAFECYYKEHYKAFYLMACKYLKDSVLAEEVVNDVFMKIWEDGAKITIEISLKSYIYKAVINRSINLLQKIKKEDQHRADLNFIPDEGYELNQMEENELKIKLYAAINQLPGQCKKVFEMSRFEGLKQQEIADKLDISIKTVKNHITHALKEISRSVDYFVILTMLILKNILHF
jgi:RNA polymerase sigma-70 factor, Bacteroides expansion family 1